MQEGSVVVWGEGEPVILVHGSGDTDPTFVWSHQRPLAAHYQLLVVTRPGYGQRPISPRPLAAEEFLVRFMKSIQPDFPETIECSSEDRKGVEAMQTEPAPWKIEIPLSTLAATTFPKLVVTSGEHNACEAVADILTQLLRATLSVCAGNGHYIPDTGEPFNQLLESFLQSAVTSTSLSYLEKGGK